MPITEPVYPVDSGEFLDHIGSYVDTGDEATVQAAQWDGSDWTFRGAVLAARPTTDAMIIWTGGDASTDSPEAWMAVGDMWLPASE